MSSDTLTIETFTEMLDKYFPVLYYALDKHMEPGAIYVCKETDFNPEFIIVHPDDLETVRKMITARRLVDLKDEPKKSQMERLNKRIRKMYPSIMILRETIS